MSFGTPQFIGSVQMRTATQLAEAAILAISALSGARGPRKTFEVSLDIAGRVVVDKPGNTPHRELLMVCTTASDPDALADCIRAEWNARDATPVKRRVVVSSRKAA